jgi:chromosome segregation protein
MFFKNLEIFGFKSFAQKTRVDFEPGVTAIVGPNGCGKTNLLDSIKWVLGEQSVYSLRGAKMEDVIFHGAADIPPVGFAEVSLTISNEQKFLPLDYEEVTITRRIFRSGESEYMINRIPVRLKDITELLMGTGLGMRSYSLMEQGKVDQILSSKPDDRRAIFEEAAGITRYKSKKEEALRKLQRTGENLQRLGDIIVEVKRQIKSMERQVNKARRYKEEFERLKEWELAVSQYEYQNLKKDKKEFSKKIEALKREETSFSSKMAEGLDALEKAKQDLSQLEEAGSRIQAENYEINTAIQTSNNKVALDQERLEELDKREIELSEQIQKLKTKIAGTEEQIEEARNQAKAVQEEKQAKSINVTEREEEINNILTALKEAEQNVNTDKNKELEVITQQTRVKNDLSKLLTQLAGLNARERRLNIESVKTREELEQIEQRLKIRSQTHQSLGEEVKKATKDLWDTKSHFNIKMEKQEALKDRLKEHSEKITRASSRLNFLKEISQRFEGFSQGVKFLLSALDSGQLMIEGIHGVLADLVEVMPQYRWPLEMALQESAQAFVVENSGTADKAINYLSSKGSGRANFICLDSLSFNSREIGLKGTLGKAQDFVKVQPGYQRLIAHLLANIYIVEDIDSARELIPKLDPAVRLVTLNGEILSRTAIMGPGTAQNSDVALLGRKERITQSESDLEKIKAEQQKIEELANNQQAEIETLRDTLQQKEADLNKLKIELANKTVEKANIESAKKRFEDEVAVLTQEREEAGGEIKQLQDEQEDLNQRVLNLEKEQKKIQADIQDHLDFSAAKQQERQHALVDIAQTKAGLSALDRESEQAQRRLDMLVESGDEQRQSQLLRAQEIEDTTNKIAQLKLEIEDLKLQTKDLTQAKLSVEEQLHKSSARRKTLSELIQTLEQKEKAVQKGLDGIRERKGNLQVGFTEINYKQDSLKDRMYQSYQVDLQATLEDTLEVSQPEESVSTEINSLKERLEGMGPVNLVAIEENDQLQQRYSFLISQQEDLSSAQESLRKAIAQINHTARKMFSETFDKVQVSFKEYFRILFGGGDARLILLEDSNVLESGIEIVVRPPGKRLQNISLLSGGERALTAIALLFAIFKVKPSPFCILDEVDAALDEVNIGRFTNLLSEFMKDSQFIMITHNKKTISMADVMYGITMEKSGISKIVSVRFTQEELRPETIAYAAE